MEAVVVSKTTSSLKRKRGGGTRNNNDSNISYHTNVGHRLTKDFHREWARLHFSCVCVQFVCFTQSVVWTVANRPAATVMPPRPFRIAKDRNDNLRLEVGNPPYPTTKRRAAVPWTAPTINSRQQWPGLVMRTGRPSLAKPQRVETFRLPVIQPTTGFNVELHPRVRYFRVNDVTSLRAYSHKMKTGKVSVLFLSLFYCICDFSLDVWISLPFGRARFACPSDGLPSQPGVFILNQTRSPWLQADTRPASGAYYAVEITPPPPPERYRLSNCHLLCLRFISTLTFCTVYYLQRRINPDQ